MTRTARTSPTPTADSNMSLQVMAESSRADVMRVWRQLETELQSRRPTSSAIWIETWLNRFGGQIPRQFVVACHGDVPYPTPVKPPIAAQRMSLDEIDC